MEFSKFKVERVMWISCQLIYLRTMNAVHIFGKIPLVLPSNTAPLSPFIPELAAEAASMSQRTLPCTRIYSPRRTMPVVEIGLALAQYTRRLPQQLVPSSPTATMHPINWLSRS